MNVIPSSNENFNIIDFWEEEKLKVENIDLGIEIGENKGILNYTNPYTKNKYQFYKQEIFFNSKNWEAASEPIIKLHGFLLYPEKYAEKGNPGCLCMHGLLEKAENSFSQAYPYLENGFIVLTYDHPGHGKSEGAPPKPEYFNFDGEYTEKAHPYLTICGAIQGLRILESLDEVDNSKIMITGTSYGGLNTMWLTSICGDKILGALPYIATGDLNKTLLEPSLLVFWLWDQNAQELTSDDEFWEKIERYFDPKTYLENSEVIPPILWQIGTTDEYFHYLGISGTYLSVPHDKAYLQIHPNGHHGLPYLENTTKFWINHLLNDGPAPSKIKVDNSQKETNLMGDTIKFEILVDSETPIESVEICYRYLDIVGSIWEKNKMNKDEDEKWHGSIMSGILSSKVDYYFIVTLEGEEQVWFSSEIFRAGVIHSSITIIFYILLLAYICMPAIFLILRRFKKNFTELDSEIRDKAKKNLMIEIIIIGVSEILFFVSLVLPWIVFESGGVVWTHIYIFNRFYNVIFLIFAPYLTAAFLIGWIFYAHLSLMKPLIASFLQIIYPIGALLILGLFTSTMMSTDLSNPASNFGTIFPGVGGFLMLFSSITVMITGIWKRKYQAKLGLRTPKNKWYNIDRWFRITGIKNKP